MIPQFNPSPALRPPDTAATPCDNRGSQIAKLLIDTLANLRQIEANARVLPRP